DLDDVPELGADGRERVLQVLERLHRLAAEVLGQFALDREAELPGDVDRPAGLRDLDHMRVARRLGNGRRIDETRRHEILPLSVCSAAGSLTAERRQSL